MGDFRLENILDQRDSHVTIIVFGIVEKVAPKYLSIGNSLGKTSVFGIEDILLLLEKIIQ